ncbi:MAG: ATP-binding cassette domain-containing protein [Methylococcaceae bacterium]|nr:ATP-binding cassette domain-containing protein [Methylococcaceae bacterium]
MLRLIDFLRKEPDFPKTRVIFMVCVSGFAGAAMLIAINQAAEAIAAGAADPQQFFIVLSLLALLVYTQHQSLLKVSEAVEEILLKLRLRIGNQLRHAPLRFLEQTGTSTIQATLANDTLLISQSALSLTLLTRSCLVVALSLAYLGWISLWALFVALALLGVYGFLYGGFVHPNLTWKLRRAQDLQKGSLRRLRALLGGIKEIKLSRRKNSALFEHYGRTEGEIGALKRGADTEVANGFTIGYCVFYLLLVVLIIILPGLNPALTGQVFKIAVTSFFILSELTPWLTWIPEIVRANAVVEEMCRLEAKLQGASHDEPALPPPETLSPFSSLHLEGVEFSCADPHGKFSLGPLDLAVAAGELLCIVGGNGSGKTTLLKLLAGLYYPRAGAIRVDDRVIDAAAQSAYRELFSAVFADYYLFERWYGGSETDPQRVGQWLETMGLSGKTDFTDGGFRPLELSRGEKWRLAFISAALEDKPIMLLDDFAADLDLEFREKLYREILPDLKRRGKTVIVAARDDFDLADRVLRLEDGRWAAKP